MSTCTVHGEYSDLIATVYNSFEMVNAMSSLDELVKGEVGRVRRRAEGGGQRRSQRVEGVVIVVIMVVVVMVVAVAAAETLEGRSEGILQLGYSPVDGLRAVGQYSMFLCFC